MIERVARAVWINSATFRGKEAYWDTMLDIDKERYISNARAAIAAMREPTEAMKAVFSSARPESPQTVWHLTIDAALEATADPGIPIYATRDATDEVLGTTDAN